MIFTSAQEPVALNCTFIVNFDEYVCNLSEVEVLDPTQEIIFVGEHIEGKTDGDVNSVKIINSNTPFMIQQIFTRFPNIVDLSIKSSHLKSINIPDSIQLVDLQLSNNEISRIASGTFIGQKNLKVFIAIDSRIEEIEENAFTGLESLTYLSLSRNNIKTVALRTFEPLVNVALINLEQNFLTRIDDIFASNTKLLSVYMGQNQINEISPRFALLIENEHMIALGGNRCIDRTINIKEEIDIFILHNALNRCFKNYSGDFLEKRRVIVEFEGSLSLYDEFGNIVIQVE